MRLILEFNEETELGEEASLAVKSRKFEVHKIKGSDRQTVELYDPEDIEVVFESKDEEKWGYKIKATLYNKIVGEVKKHKNLALLIIENFITF